MKKVIILLLFISVFGQGHAQSKAPSHELYDKLLKKHVSVNGVVDYKGFIKDSSELNQYLKVLSTTPPDEKNWSRQEQMAYWINAYNAFTIQLVCRYYPVKSIKDIGSKVQIPFVNSVWDIKFIRIGKEKMDLNNIEHGQLRKNFDDPRVHMALVCASKSCPILLNEAFEASKLDNQFAKQTKAFLADPNRNKMSATAPQLNMIFRWYGMDFNKNGGSVRSFINTYSDVKIAAEAEISHLDYDWALNDK